MEETTRKVSKIVRELHDEMGGVMPIEDVLERGSESGLSEEEILEGIDDLEMHGVISKLDKDSIEFM